MRRWVVTGIALLVGVLSLGFVGRAQEWGEWGRGFRGPWGHGMGPRLMALLENDRMKAALGLTDQQTERLRQIMVETQKSSVRNGAELALRGIELREMLRSEKPDRDAVMKKVQEISDLRRAMMVQHIDALLASKTVLTPEQQKKIRSFLERRRAGFGPERVRERGPRLPQEPGSPPEPPRPSDEPSVQ